MKGCGGGNEGEGEGDGWAVEASELGACRRRLAAGVAASASACNPQSISTPFHSLRDVFNRLHPFYVFAAPTEAELKKVRPPSMFVALLIVGAPQDGDDEESRMSIERQLLSRADKLQQKYEELRLQRISQSVLAEEQLGMVQFLLEEEREAMRQEKQLRQRLDEAELERKRALMILAQEKARLAEREAEALRH